MLSRGLLATLSRSRSYKTCLAEALFKKKKLYEVTLYAIVCVKGRHRCNRGSPCDLMKAINSLSLGFSFLSQGKKI